MTRMRILTCSKKSKTSWTTRLAILRRPLLHQRLLVMLLCNQFEGQSPHGTLHLPRVLSSHKRKIEEATCWDPKSLSATVFDTASFSTQSTQLRFSNSTTVSGFTNPTKAATANDTEVGTVIANKTHVLLGSDQPVQMQAFNVKKLFVSDLTFRVFHLTQAGHAIISNLILFQMAHGNAECLGK